MNESALKSTLKAGALVFGSSAIFLLIAPGVFLSLLSLEHNAQNAWSMRMLGITVFALSGNMLAHALNSNTHALKMVSWVMCVSAFALGVCTLCIPAHVTPFCVIYALVGFGFSFSYVFNLLFAKRAAAK
jgi:hypothetical protein